MKTCSERSSSACSRGSCAQATSHHLLDNAGAHRTERVRALIKATGASVLYLPPYSPDLNPIELCWSKLKGLLREFGARSRDALDAAIRRAMDLVDRHDVAGWFKHCGYQSS